MNTAKVLLTVVLLLFVAAGAVYLLVDAFRQDAAVETPSQTAALVEKPQVEAAAAATESRTPHKVVAYYFHGTKRCKTCRRIEAYTQEAITGRYGDHLRDGRLEWHSLNVDEPANEHFVQDYEIAMSSVILVEIRDGKEQRWKNLERIWHLTGDKDAFLAYIQEEADAFLGEKRG